MQARLVRKLRCAAQLSVDDVLLLSRILADVRHIAAKEVIIHAGEPPKRLSILLDGWALRWTVLPNGSRQVLGILLPGDFCNGKTLEPACIDHAITASSDTIIASFTPEELGGVLLRSRPIREALWRHNLIEEAVQRSWLVSLGRRNALARLAHLFCELHVRLRWLGLAENGVFGFPLTQTAVADATGMTSIHLNRTAQALRSGGLLAWRQKSVKVLDVEGLRKAADFDAEYLLGPLSARLPL